MFKSSRNLLLATAVGLALSGVAQANVTVPSVGETGHSTTTAAGPVPRPNAGGGGDSVRVSALTRTA